MELAKETVRRTEAVMVTMMDDWMVSEKVKAMEQEKERRMACLTVLVK